MTPLLRRLGPEATRFWLSTCRAVGVVAALFSVAVAAVLVANAVQLAVVKPLDSPALIAARELYRGNPDSDALAEHVRALDLMARRAYFARQWQIRTGAYLLLAGAAVLAGCLRGVAALRRSLPEPGPAEAGSAVEGWAMRRGLAAVGILVVAAGLAASVFSIRSLGEERSVTGRITAARAGQPPASGAAPGSSGGPVAAAAEPSAAAPAAAAGGPSVATGAPTADPGLTTSAAFRRNWPQFRGPGGNAVAAPQDPPTRWDGQAGTNILWKTQVPHPGFGSPVIWEGQVFLSGSNGPLQEIYCWDAHTGELQWRRPIQGVPGSPSQPPRVTEDTGYAASTMAVNGSAAFAMFATGDLAAVDLEGELLWTLNLGLPEHMYGYASSLALYGDLLIVQFDQERNGRLLALEAATGRIRWQTPRRVQPSWASPLVIQEDGLELLVVNGSPILAGYDPGTGRLLWQFEGMLGEVAPSPAYEDGRVFAGNQLLNLLAVDAASGDRIWETFDDIPDVASPLAAGELLVMAASYGVVTCLEAATGEPVWQREFDTGFYASPVLAGGRIYLLDRSGVMRILSADREGRLIDSPPLGEAADATPAFREGRIYIRGERHLFCIGEADG